MSEELEEIMEEEKPLLSAVLDLTGQPFIPSTFISMVKTYIRSAYEENKYLLGNEPWFVIRVGISDNEGNITFGFFKYGGGTYCPDITEAPVERIIKVSRTFAEFVYNAPNDPYLDWVRTLFPECDIPSFDILHETRHPMRILGRMFDTVNRGIYLPIHPIE